MSEQKIKKELPIEIKEANDKDRTITAIISKEILDRDGDVIAVKGIQAKHWKANPVILADHANSVENVIGKGVGKKFWVTGDEALIKFELATEKVNPKAELVFQLYKGGFLQTMSLSFIPDWDKVAYGDEAKKAGAPKGTNRYFGSVEMIEATVTPLPSNRSAFMKSANEAWDAGVIDGLQLNMCEEMYPPEECEDGGGSADDLKSSDELMEELKPTEISEQVSLVANLEINDIKAIEMAEDKAEVEDLTKQLNDRDTKIMELELLVKEQQMEEEEQEFDSYLADLFGEFNQVDSSESEADVEQTDEEWAEETLTLIEEDNTDE